MEFDSPLNQAHRNVRKSEKLQKTGKFQEAIDLQDKIVDLLAESLEGVRDEKIRESISLQIENHKQQKQVIFYKQARWDKLCQQLNNLQVKMSNVSASGSGDGLQVCTISLS